MTRPPQPPPNGHRIWMNFAAIVLFIFALIFLFVCAIPYLLGKL